jgi:hypothetical protein
MVDGESRHWYVRPALSGDDRYESVTAVISAANDSSMFLTPWAAKIAAHWCLAHHDFVGDMLAEIGFDATLAAAAKAAERRRELAADIGVYQHDVIEALILDKALPVIPEHLVDVEIDGERVDLDAISDGFLNFVADYDPRFLLAEATVVDLERRTAGTLDFVAELPTFPDGQRVKCVDTKSGRVLRPTMRAQLAAYRASDEVWLDDLGTTAPMPYTDGAAVLHLRREYSRGYKLIEVAANQRELDWFDVMARQYHMGREFGSKLGGRVLYPPLPDGTQPAPLLEDTALRCRAVLMGSGYRSLADLDGVPAATLRAIKGVGPKAMQDIAALIFDWRSGAPIATPADVEDVA